jgi:uncharacterized membrane protein YphA (DoxX/SURF4 family)
MHDNTNSKSLGYWLTTGVLAVVLLMAGIMSLMGRPEITEMMEQLGYPVYLAALLGIAKVLGAVAIIAPKLPRLKEWAYAGIAFDLGGALFSHMRMGNFDQTIAPLMLLLLALASWYLRPADRKLADPK